MCSDFESELEKNIETFRTTASLPLQWFLNHLINRINHNGSRLVS